MKKCSTCKIIKNSDSFYKDKSRIDQLQRICISCEKERKSKVYLRDKQEILEDSKSYYWSNKERISKTHKNYYLRSKEDRKDHNKKYREENKELIRNTARQYEEKRRKIDVLFKIKKCMRTRTYNAIKNNAKSGSAVRDLGCSIEELKIYLESKFLSGMTWENYSHKGWHIDHKVPLSSFNLSNREEFLKAVHYTNLQPLWAIDNFKKSDIIVF